jgi:transposase-like protein
MHLRLRYLALIVLTLALLIPVGVAMLQALFRSSTMPVCWSCGARQVRPSGTRSATDLPARLLLLIPYRCRSCQRRFYAFRTSRALAQPRG